MKRWLMSVFLVLISAQVFAQSYMWDVLRPATDFASEIDVPVKVVVFLLSAGIFAISFLAYNKSESKRLLLVSVAFFLFSMKWLVKLIDIFVSPGYFLADSSENLFELGILLSLLVALFYTKKGKGFFKKE